MIFEGHLKIFLSHKRKIKYCCHKKLKVTILKIKTPALKSILRGDIQSISFNAFQWWANTSVDSFPSPWWCFGTSWNHIQVGSNYMYDGLDLYLQHLPYSHPFVWGTRWTWHLKTTSGDGRARSFCMFIFTKLCITFNFITSSFNYVTWYFRSPNIFIKS